MKTSTTYERTLFRLNRFFPFSVIFWPIKRFLRATGLSSHLKAVLGGPRLTVRRSEGRPRSLRSRGDRRHGGRGREVDAVLIGGWGYGNLGDEAILAGYLLDAESRGLRLDVLSVDPRRDRDGLGGTFNLGDNVRLLDESRVAISGVPEGRPVVVAGGGYLNGSWHTEVSGKLRRIRAIRRKTRLITHAPEIRLLDSEPLRSDLTRVLQGAQVSVRDDASAEALRSLEVGRVEVVPDAISLLVPHVSELVSPRPELRGKLLVNLLDVPARNDAHEAEFELKNWRSQCSAMIGRAALPVVGLAMDREDADFMRDLGLEVIVPGNVVELVSAIAGSAGLVSTRMHPALISTMLGRPTKVLPYCGKVRITLRNLGLDAVVQPPGDIGSAVQPQDTTQFAESWRTKYVETAEWLYSRIGGTAAG